MKHQKQWNTFFAIEKSIPYEPHMRNTKELSQLYLASMTGKRRPSLSFNALVKKQLKFTAWKIWFFQGMLLSALCALFLCLCHAHYIRWFTSALPKFLCCCSGIIAMSAVPILRRSLRYQMLELEQSTRFSMVGILTAQLLFIGIGDLSMLAVLALLVLRFKLTGSVAFVALVIPFMTTAVTGLMLWVRTASPVFERLSVLLCILTVLLTSHILDWYRDSKETVRIGFWILYVLACLCILYREARRMRLMNRMEKLL